MNLLTGASLLALAKSIYYPLQSNYYNACNILIIRWLVTLHNNGITKSANRVEQYTVFRPLLVFCSTGTTAVIASTSYIIN